MNELDNQTPGGIYLCQVNENISCGACCGLYNVSDPSYENLVKILEYRTRLFQQTPRDYDSLLEFRHIIVEKEDKQRPFPEFHHCRYIGLIGKEYSRPGCLLHPWGEGNNNVDHRGLSHWGGFACASYFCPTCRLVPSRYKQILRLCADNWQVYGLIVTETDMLNAFFSDIEEKKQGLLLPEVFEKNDELRKAVIQFFKLKNTWPFRPPGFNKFGNYFFKDNLYPNPPVDYQSFGLKRSRYDTILVALGSVFASSKELKNAESLISELINKVLALL